MPVIISLFYRKVAQRLARREVDQKGRTLGTKQQFHRLNLGQSLVIQNFAHEGKIVRAKLAIFLANMRLMYPKVLYACTLLLPNERY